MAGLEEQVSLDITAALTDADQLATQAGEALEAALTAAVDSFTSSFSTAADSIQSQLAEALSAEQTVPVTADTSAAETAVGALASEVDATDASINIEADTSGADQSLSSLDDQLQVLDATAQDTGDQIGSLADPTSALGAVSGLATGQLGGLTESLLGIGGKTTVAVGSVAALSGGIYELAQAGTTATSAEERFNAIVGETAVKVEQIHVGTLTTDLAKLGLQFGSTDSAMKNTAASLFAFAQNSGASRDEAARFTTEVTALGARAVSLNPELGNLADVTESLSTRLSRGGRFAAAYGLSLTAPEINARALANTHKTAASDLTVYEKATAAADIASERYGSTLGVVVANGAKNAANEQKSLKAQLEQIIETAGKPLVGGFFEAVRESLPSVLAIATPLAQIGVSVLPAIASAASLAAPPLRLIAEAVNAVPAPLLATFAGAVLLNSVLGILGAKLAANAVAATEAAAADAELAAAEGAATAGAVAQSGATGIAATTGAALTAGTVSLSSAVLTAGVGVGAFAATTWALHTAQDALFGSVRTTADYLNDEASAAKAAADPTGNLVVKFENLVKHLAPSGQNESALVLQLRAFRDIAEQNIGTASVLASKFSTNSELGRGMALILGELAGKTNTDTAATKANADAQTLLTGSYADQIKILNEKDDALSASYDVTFASIHADENERDAIATLNTAYDDAIKSGKSQQEAQEAQNRALVAAEEAATRASKAVRDKSESDNAGLGSQAAAIQATRDQIGSLEGLVETLDPGSPLRVFLEQYIVKLKNEIPPAVATTVTADTSQAQTALDRLTASMREIRGQSTIGSGENPTPFYIAAEGMVVEPRPGGTLVNVAEAGHREVILPTDDDSRALALLEQSGLGRLLAPNVPRSLPTGLVVPAATAPVIHLEVVNQLDARGLMTTTTRDARTGGTTLAVQKQKVRAGVASL